MENRDSWPSLAIIDFLCPATDAHPFDNAVWLVGTGQADTNMVDAVVGRLGDMAQKLSKVQSLLSSKW